MVLMFRLTLRFAFALKLIQLQRGVEASFFC